MKRFYDWVLARAQERTTWYGVTSLLASIGIAISPELQTAIAEVGLAVSGLILIWMKECADPEKAEKERGED